jgi:hypothetical protein
MLIKGIDLKDINQVERVKKFMKTEFDMGFDDTEYTFALYTQKQDKTIQNIVQKYLDSIEDITFIVVTDMNSIRYSHPIESRVGEKFVGGDEKRVVENGYSYHFLLEH